VSPDWAVTTWVKRLGKLASCSGWMNFFSMYHFPF
jgi:hypothetical protein